MVKSIKTTIYLKNSYNDKDILGLMTYFKKRYRFVPKKFGTEYLVWGQYLKRHLSASSATEEHLVSISKDLWNLFSDLREKKIEINLVEVNKHLVLKQIKTIENPSSQVCGKSVEVICICKVCEPVLAS